MNKLNKRNKHTCRIPPGAAPLLALTLLLAVAGCGEWVVYDPDADAGGGQCSNADFPKVTTMQHLAQAGLMARYISYTGDGLYTLVDYDGIKASSEASYQVDQIRSNFAAVDPSNLKDEKQRLAYWFNGYNISVIAGVLANYNGDHKFRVTDSGSFFDRSLYTFGGVTLSLNQLEMGVLRGVLNHDAVLNASAAVQAQIAKWHKEAWGGKTPDPRLHAVINCSALSCPNQLANPPYVYDPDKVEQQLADATKNWLDNEEKGAGKNGISALFQWYTPDFEATHGSVDNFIKAYRTNGLTGVDTSKYLDYDWTLNILPKK
jgi:hypothetical protein